MSPDTSDSQRRLIAIENGLPASCIANIRRLGHEVGIIPPPEGPHSVACIRRLNNNTLLAGNDPRRDRWVGVFKQIR